MRSRSSKFAALFFALLWTVCFLSACASKDVAEQAARCAGSLRQLQERSCYHLSERLTSREDGGEAVEMTAREIWRDGDDWLIQSQLSPELTLLQLQREGAQHQKTSEGWNDQPFTLPSFRFEGLDLEAEAEKFSEVTATGNEVRFTYAKKYCKELDRLQLENMESIWSSQGFDENTVGMQRALYQNSHTAAVYLTLTLDGAGKVTAFTHTLEVDAAIVEPQADGRWKSTGTVRQITTSTVTIHDTGEDAVRAEIAKAAADLAS